MLNIVLDPPRWNPLTEGLRFDASFPSRTLNTLFKSVSLREAIRFYRANSDRFEAVHYTTALTGRPFPTSPPSEITDVHDDVWPNSPSAYLLSTYYRHLVEGLRHSPYLITVTRVLKNKLASRGFTGHIEAIYQPVDDHFSLMEDKRGLREMLKLPTDKILLLSVASAERRKNRERIVQAVRELGPKHILVNVGPPLEGGIAFRGVDDERLNAIYNACDLLLFPSLYEGQGMPIAEAFATGLPVVTSDTPELREVTGGAAILVNPLDPSSIAAGVRQALQSHDELVDLGTRRAPVFAFDRFRDKILAFYNSIKV